MHFEAVVFVRNFVTFEIGFGNESPVKKTASALELCLGLAKLLLGHAEIIFKFADFLFGLAIAEFVDAGILRKVDMHRVG